MKNLRIFFFKFDDRLLDKFVQVDMRITNPLGDRPLIDVAQIKRIIDKYEVEVLFLEMLPLARHPRRYRFVFPRNLKDTQCILTKCVLRVVQPYFHKTAHSEYFVFGNLCVFEPDNDTSVDLDSSDSSGEEIFTNRNKVS